MKKFIVLFFCTVPCIAGKSQQLDTKTVNATGRSSSVGGITLEWSIGEMTCVQTFVAPGVVLTQGLLQPLLVSDAPLPLTLLYFTAKSNAQNVLLKWATSQEVNTSHFDLERSDNGTDFRVLQKVLAAGNSSSPQTYQVIDPTPFIKTYYRLKQVDLDNKFAYSQIVQLQISKAITFTLYPNPTKGLLSLSLQQSDEVSQLVISDLTGRTVMEKQYSGASAATLDVSGLSKGIYIITVRSNKGSWATRFVKY